MVFKTLVTRYVDCAILSGLGVFTSHMVYGGYKAVTQNPTQPPLQRVGNGIGNIIGSAVVGTGRGVIYGAVFPFAIAHGVHAVRHDKYHMFRRFYDAEYNTYND